MTKIFKDPFGNDIKVGHPIAHVRRFCSGRYLNLVHATVARFTDEFVVYTDSRGNVGRAAPHLVFVDVTSSREPASTPKPKRSSKAKVGSEEPTE